MTTITSIDRIGSLAVLRSALEHGEGGASLAIDLAPVRHAPTEHFIGVDFDLFDAARVDPERSKAPKDLLDELDVRLGVIFNAADLEETRVVFWPGPDHGDDMILGTVLSVHVNSPVLSVGRAA